MKLDTNLLLASDMVSEESMKIACFHFSILLETLLRSVFMELDHMKARQLSQRNSFLSFPNPRIPSLVSFTGKKVGSFPK